MGFARSCLRPPFPETLWLLVMGVAGSEAGSSVSPLDLHRRPVLELADTRLSWAGSDARPSHARTKWSPVVLIQLQLQFLEGAESVSVSALVTQALQHPGPLPARPPTA
ncbi:hypothetical protein U0070_006466 [Myodes glareolus]|uniref:Secreted protein n=1 Tax=Myodes glareolus TaxID=447135 RepID=A0AAW0HSX6_MYOGA